MNKKVFITIGVIVGVVLLGFGIYQTDASQNSPKLTMGEVEEMMKDQYPGTITEIELKKKHNQYVYDVEMQDAEKEYELKLNADTGEVLKLEEKVAKSDEMNLQSDNDKDAQGDNKETSSGNEATDDNEPKESDNTKGTIIDPRKAIDIALAAYSGTITELELEKEDGRLIYEVEMKSGMENVEIEIDAYTGDVIKDKRKQGNKHYEKQSVIHPNEAIDIALEEYSGTIVELELEKDDGKLIYEVEFKSETEEVEIEIDALTGEVLEMEIEQKK